VQTSMGSGSGIGVGALLCAILVIVLVCIHRAVDETSFFGDVFGGRHPSYPPCDLARQRYCPQDGYDLHDPRQQRHPGGHFRCLGAGVRWPPSEVL
jgi:hypothetical protein